jgi:flagellar motor component MotA
MTTTSLDKVDHIAAGIVFFGVILSAFMAFPLSGIAAGFRRLGKCCDKVRDMQMLLHIAANIRARQAIESDELEPFIVNALTLAADGIEPVFLREALNNELLRKKQACADKLRFWVFLSQAASVWGLFGAVLGLLMGSGIWGLSRSVSLFSALYGIALNILLNIVRMRINIKSQKQLTRMSAVIYGLMSIFEGDNTELLKEKLKAVFGADGL